ncbi:uncharacterized protein LOC120629451 [Pararge aegeria]|uniref:uncharacterized protein LOC120629451 n=1 Tax=Pararge aegeria TaxID=116150 RepID=UPI0019D18C4D|nr:uncharacterized protein LOC120629451 [Pararge aegeria]
MTSFGEVTRQVHLINDLILSEMICVDDDYTEEKLEFSKHMLATKYWFAPISYANKKRFVLALLKDVRSIWTLSLLLKSIWNCRPKDAMMSACEPRVWSSYDQVPMDHDRTARPLSLLAEVMMSDRQWFQTLEPERQALVLAELLTVAGGPVMWEVLKRAQKIYDRHVELQLEDLQECKVVPEPLPPKQTALTETTPAKKEQAVQRKIPPEAETVPFAPAPGQAQKELETKLALWASTVKAMKDRMKLEELEMTFKNGTTKLWKVNRPKPEDMETVDFIQLLPSAISKRILINLTHNQLMDCARVNKYWAFLVEDIRAEIIVRQKIDVELEKLRENVMKHDRNLDLLSKSELGATTSLEKSFAEATQAKERFSVLARNKSCAVSLWTIVNKQGNKPRNRAKPIRNLNEMNERLERRGAADENIWKWCRNVLKISRKYDRIRQIPVEKGGILSMATETFPGPVMSKTVKIPLDYPLLIDPSRTVPVKAKETVAYSSADASIPQQKKDHRYTLWSNNFLNLYPVCKISSHLSPF